MSTLPSGSSSNSLTGPAGKNITGLIGCLITVEDVIQSLWAVDSAEDFFRMAYTDWQLMLQAMRYHFAVAGFEHVQRRTHTRKVNRVGDGKDGNVYHH